MMETIEAIPHESQGLRRCLRELAALSTLSAVWSQKDLPEIADGLGLVLFRALPLEFVYVRATAENGAVDAAHTLEGPVSADETRQLAQKLRPLLTSGAFDRAATVCDLFGDRPLRLAVIPLGYDGSCGVIVAGSERQGFPSQTDRLLLNVAANQAAIVLQHKRAEKQLSRSERELADFFENATVGLHWVGPDGIILRANRAELELLGYTAEEYVGRHIAEFHADPDVIEDVLRRLTAGEEIHDYEARMRCKDGSIKHVLINSNVLWRDGQFIHTRCFTRDITDRKRAEELLRENERRFRKVIDALPAAIYTTDAEGRVTHFNPAAVELSGRTPELGTDRWCVSWKLYYPDGSPMPHDQCPMAIALKEGRPIRGAEAILERPDGTRIWFMPYPTPLRDAEGRVIGGINMLVDISERKLAEETNAKLAAIVESSDDAIMSISLNGIISSWNRGAEHVYGYTAEEVIGQPISQLIPSDRLDEERRILERIRRGDKVDHYETVRRRKDGKLRNISLTVSPVLDGHGKVVGASKIARDITDRKRAEERLQLLWEAAGILLTAEDPDAMLRGLLAKIGPHLGVDTYFNFMVNETGEALRLASYVGIPEEAARNITRLEFGQAICGNVALLRQAIEATHIQTSTDPRAQLVRSLGLRAYACNPLMAGDVLLGTLSFATRSKDKFETDELEFIQTISRYVTAAYERLRLLAQLKEADRRKDEFLATLAHELRNPLAPITNAIALLRRANGDRAVLDDANTLLTRQVQHLVRLIDDLLDVSRISRGKLQLRKERVELATVLENAVESTYPMIEGGRHQLTVTLPPKGVYLDGDPIRLCQLFSNLLNNAAKYTDRGGHIGLSAETHGNEVAVSVRDTGIGIPPEQLPRIFEMFSQLTPALERSQGGLGIGLALVRALVDLHGGRIEAHSSGPGMGSEFTVYLPVIQIVRPNQQPTEVGPAVESGRKFRILVVDDNRDAANSLAAMLRTMGRDTHLAYDGLEAVQLAATIRPDVALLDIGLPKMTGYEVARHLRHQPGGDQMVIIAVTGWGQEEDKRRAMEAGCDQHITKPLDVALLERLLATMTAVPQS